MSRLHWNSVGPSQDALPPFLAHHNTASNITKARLSKSPAPSRAGDWIACIMGVAFCALLVWSL